MRLFLTLGISSLLFLAACTTSPEDTTEPTKESTETSETEVLEEKIEETVLTPTASPSIDLAQAGNAANAWADLIENGCDTSKIWTPMEAKVLRNTPYAMRGYSFSKVYLRAFFEEDGASYYEAHTTEIVLPEDAQACVDALASREAELLEKMPMTDAQLARFTTPTVFEALQFWGEIAEESPYANARITEENGELRFESLYGECEGVDDCGGYIIECPFGDVCYPIAAG